MNRKFKPWDKVVLPMEHNVRPYHISPWSKWTIVNEVHVDVGGYNKAVFCYEYRVSFDVLDWTIEINFLEGLLTRLDLWDGKTYHGKDIIF